MFLKLDTFYTFCCSTQLSYVRMLVRTVGFEPTTHRPFASIKTLLLLVSKQNEEARHMEPWYRQGDSDPHAYFSGRFLDLIKRFELLSLKRAHYLCYTKESAVSTNSTIPAYSVQQLLTDQLSTYLPSVRLGRGLQEYSYKLAPNYLGHFHC